MKTSFFKNKSETAAPVLVIDKVGVIGEGVARHFSKDNLVVLVSEKLFSREGSNILHVPFKKKIPQVPDNEYSKIFLVDDGNSVTRESAFSFVNKALENNAPLYFIGSIRNVDVEHADEVAKSYKNAKVLLFGDLFDNILVFDKNSSINQFIASVRKEQKIQVTGDGLALNFPITFIDTIKLIIKATELDLQQKIIMLFSGRPITDVSLANVFKKNKPTILIEFNNKGKNKKIYIPRGAMHALDKYDIEEKIKNLDLGKTEKKTVNVKEGSKSKNKPRFAYITLFLLFIFLLPFISTYALLFLGNFSFNRVEDAFGSGNISNIKSYAGKSLFFFNASSKTLFVLNKELSLLRLNDLSSDLNKKIEIGTYLSEATQDILNAIVGYESIISGKTDSPRDVFYASSNNFKNGMDLIEKSESIGLLPKKFSKIATDLNPASELLSSQEIALNILGFDKEKKYLIIELDNKENQPAGGQAGRMKLVFVKNGKITNSKNINPDDLGTYDENKIDVPFYAMRYNGVKTPSISNSFYKIGFSQNAKDIMSIYSSVNSQPIDGVIGMTSSYYDTLGKMSFFNFIKTISRRIKEKNILVSVSEDDIQKVFDTKNWSGTTLDNRGSQQGVVNDYFGIVESGINKDSDNSKVSKTVSKKISLNSKGILSSTLTIAINNSGNIPHKSYIQFLLPNKSTLSEIKIDEVTQKIINAVIDPDVFGAKNFKAPLGLEVEQHSESDKQVAGFLVEIPSDSVRTAALTYDLPYLINNSQESFKYSLILYKQPGIADYNFRLDFSLPASYQIINPSSNFELNLNQDKSISATITRK